MGVRFPHVDTCKIGAPGTPAGGEPNPGSYTYGSAIRCRVVRKAARETADGAEARLTNIQIRVPVGTTVITRSRIQLTHQRRAALSPVKYFDVIGEPQETIDEIILDCVTANPGT